MQASIPYYYQEQSTDTLVDNDIGNCTIVANNDLNQTYIMSIRTEYGLTRILEYGPYGNVMPTHCECVFDQFDYTEYRIKSRIEKFLNTRSRLITQAQECEYEDVASMLKNPAEYLYYEQAND